MAPLEELAQQAPTHTDRTTLPRVADPTAQQPRTVGGRVNIEEVGDFRIR